MILNEVLMRVREDFALEMHVDTDEGNAAMLKNSQILEILK